MKTSRERFVEGITKGLWIFPQRQREIRQEILDHLEDITEEEKIEEWTEEMLKKQFGPVRKLRGLFAKNGLPRWAKCLKWCLYGIAVLFALLLLLDLGVLWFYKVDPELVQLLRKKHPFVENFTDEGYFIPSVKTAWLDPGDEIARRTMDKFETCKAAYEAYIGRRDEAKQEFLEQHLPPEANGENRIPPTPFPGMNGMGMGIPDPAEKLSNEEKLELQRYQEDKSREEFQTFFDTWVMIAPEDRLGHPRPTAEPEDVELLRERLKLTAPQPNDLRLYQEKMWLGLAISQQKMNPGKLSLEESIQRAKELFATFAFHRSLLAMLSELSHASETLEPQPAARLAEASARWCRLSMDAVNPNPEPLIDLLVLAACSGIVQETIQHHVKSTTDIQTFERALTEFTRIDFGKTSKLWPQFLQEMNDRPWSIGDSIAGFYSNFGFFRAQCSLMQRFCRENSDSYYRYEILKRSMFALLVRIALPNFINAKTRMDVVIANQAIAKTILKLHEISPNGEKLQEFIPLKFGIADPFHEDGLKFERKENRFVIRSAGPNRLFDASVYSPSNGIVSRGDLVWRLNNN